MAKRPNAIGQMKKSHSRKTAKRLAIKRLMLTERAKKRNHK
jgi:hypothetical protein